MGNGLSSNGELAGMVLTGLAEALRADRDFLVGAEDEVDVDEVVGSEDEEASEIFAETEKHLGRGNNELACAEVDAGAEVSDRLRSRPVTLLRQLVEAAISIDRVIAVTMMW